MARGQVSVMDEEVAGGNKKEILGEQTVSAGEHVLIIDGVVEEDRRGEEKSIALSVVEDSVGSGVGISTGELRRMVELDEERRTIIRDYIARNLKAGVDYGTIESTNSRGETFKSKPSLFKPGAEKICMLLQLRAEFEPDHDTLAMAGSPAGLFAYVCRLLDRYGRVVGEGRGASDLGEKRGWTVNNAVKIAEKRSQIDAVLRVVCLSEIFTQDLEDAEQRAAMEQEPRRSNAGGLPARGSVVAEGGGGYGGDSTAGRGTAGEELCTDTQANQIRALLQRAGVTEGELLTSLNITSIRKLTRNKAYRVIDRLAEKARARGQ